jgi:hypothetical protein
VPAQTFCLTRDEMGSSELPPLLVLERSAQDGEMLCHGWTLVGSRNVGGLRGWLLNLI